MRIYNMAKKFNRPRTNEEIKERVINRLNTLYNTGVIQADEEPEWLLRNYHFSYIETGINCRSISLEDFTTILKEWRFDKIYK